MEGRSSTDSDLLPVHSYAVKTNESLPPGKIQEFDARAIQELVKDVVDYYDVAAAFVALEAPEGLKLKARHGISLQCVGHSSIAKHGIARNLPIIIENTQADRRFAQDALVAGPPALGFFAGAPLMMTTKNCVGSLCIMDFEGRPFSLQDAAFLQRCARTACEIYRGVVDVKELWVLTVSSLVSLEDSESYKNQDGGIGTSSTLGSLPEEPSAGSGSQEELS